MLMANLPMRLVASLVDSSTNQLESTYSRFIADYSGEVSRRGLAGLAEALS